VFVAVVLVAPVVPVLLLFLFSFSPFLNYDEGVSLKAAQKVSFFYSFSLFPTPSALKMR